MNRPYSLDFARLASGAFYEIIKNEYPETGNGHFKGEPVKKLPVFQSLFESISGGFIKTLFQSAEMPDIFY
jgi:hypothetical protein